jgi:hypothetical protein
LIYQEVKGWQCGSSSREPALQARSPEFKPQSHLHPPKKTTKKKTLDADALKNSTNYLRININSTKALSEN